MSQESHRIYTRFIAWIFIFSSVSMIGCGGGGGSGATEIVGTTPQTLNVTIRWNANKELRVNQSGGGYKVYISQTSGFDVADADVTTIDVPWVSGGQAPLSKNHMLSSGTYFVKVAAYSSFPVSNTSSAPSSQITVSVPFTTP